MEKQFKKRNAILQCLRDTKLHPSAEMVHQMLQKTNPDISLATVYRNLSWFREKGLVTTVANVHGAERFDAETVPHVHFVCDHCDKVLDLEQVSIPESLTFQVGSSGCTVSGYSLTFTGLCQDCQ